MRYSEVRGHSRKDAYAALHAGALKRNIGGMRVKQGNMIALFVLLFVISLSFCLFFSVKGWSDSEAMPAYDSLPGGTVKGEDRLLQFTTPDGHMVVFQRRLVIVGARDHMLRVELVGAQAVAPVSEDGPAPGGEGMATRGPRLKKVMYQEAWQGVTVVYEASDKTVLKSTYHIRANVPGQPVQQIRLRYNRPVSLDNQGNLVIAYENGTMTESAPVAWQDIDGRRKSVQVSFVLLGNNEVGFAVGDYDHSRQLVIDPSLIWNTVLGGAGSDYAQAIAVDSSGNLYVAGYSTATWGTPVRAFDTGDDAFVAKLDSSGNLVWNTFLGGAGTWDRAQGIAVDGSGNVYVSGDSGATWGTPMRAYSSGLDVFVAKLDSSGNLVWNTFLGAGSSINDYGYAVAVDGSGNVYVGGASNATWGTPVRAFGTGPDGFAAKLDSSGALAWNTFLGGTSSDFVEGIAVDGSGNVYVAGWSTATWGAPVRAYTNSVDAVVAKLDSSGSLTWNTFLGGSGADYARAITLDGSGNVYVAGNSSATWGSPVQAFFGGSNDGFAVKLTNAGTLTWNTFLGGSGEDNAYHVAVDAGGNVYLAGSSTATWGTPWQAYGGGPTDAFGAALYSSGALAWNGFLGSSGGDTGSAIAVDGSGKVYVAGLPGDAVHVKPPCHPRPPSARPWDERERKAVFVGRLGPEKGVDLLIDAWVKWGNEAPSLEVIGEGPERTALETKAAMQHLNEKIRFTGQLSFEEAQGRLSRAQMLVLPSLSYEGFPMVILEAFALGVPVAASRIGSLPFIVDDGNVGVLFTPGKSDDLLSVLQGAWKEASRLEAMGNSAREKFDRAYSSAANGDALMHIYSHAMSRRREKA